MGKLMYFIGGLLTAGLGMAAYAALEENNGACHVADTANDADDDAEMGGNNLGFAEADVADTDAASSIDAASPVSETSS